MKSIFISSTFKDMQAERDLLHEKIFPRLRRVIAEYGEDVQELDLRWGVDTANMTEEESGRLVLKVCIDAIDCCIPFIIVLLGERYGWIPGEDIVASVKDTRVDKYYEPGMSITNLEIQYGALREEAIVGDHIDTALNLHSLKKTIYNLVTVKGAAGTGKSALMASCARRIEKIRFPVITYFSGNPGCQNPKVLKQILIYELERILKLEHEEYEMALDERLSLLDEKAKRKKVICMIDALDQLYEKENEPELDFIRLCPNIIFVTSFLDDFKYTTAIGKEVHTWELELKELTKTNKEQMIIKTAA